MNDLDKSPSLVDISPRPSLKRIDNLQQKLRESSNACYAELDTRTTKQKMIEFLPFACLATIALNLDLSSQRVLLTKVLLIFLANVHTLYYKTYHETPKPLRIFPNFAVYILMQPLIISTILFRSSLPLERHPHLYYQSATNDAQTLLVLLIGFWIKIDLPEDEIKAIAKAGSMLIAVNSIILSTVLGWESPSFLLTNLTYAMVLLAVGRLCSSRIAVHKKSIQSELKKASDGLQKELAEAKAALESSYNHVTEDAAAQGDQVLMKLKFLKFQKMIKSEENSNEKVSPKPFKGRKNVKKFSMMLDKDLANDPRKINSAASARRPTLQLTTSERARAAPKIEEEQQTSLKNKWELTTKDIDTIINVMLQKTQQNLWIPNALQGSLTDEAFK